MGSSIIRLLTSGNIFEVPNKSLFATRIAQCMLHVFTWLGYAQCTPVTYQLAEPLARAAGAGASMMPLRWGSAVDPVELTQWIPGMAGGSATAMIAPDASPDLYLIDDPWLDELPVWPDGNWRDDPTAVVAGVITRQDFSPAEPWVRRDDPWPVATFQRRYLASTPDEIARWRLDHDAIDWYWHSPRLVEITLTARKLPEPLGYERWVYEGD